MHCYGDIACIVLSNIACVALCVCDIAGIVVCDIACIIACVILIACNFVTGIVVCDIEVRDIGDIVRRYIAGSLCSIAGTVYYI